MIHRIPAPHRSRLHSARRGVALILVLVFLALTTVFVTGWLVAGNSMHDHLQLWEDRAQTRWLAQSGLDRTASEFAIDKNHAGDQWTIPAGELGGRYSAVITTKVEQSADQPNHRAVEALVELKAGDEIIVRISKQVTIELPAEEESS